MTTVAMKNPYQAFYPLNAGIPLELPLPAGQALTLRADASARALWVHEGRVRLTSSCSRRASRQCAGALPPDVVLSAGQSHTLPAGSEWVLQAWPEARACVLQAVQAVQALQAVQAVHAQPAFAFGPGAVTRFMPGVWATSLLSRWRQRR
ncbi:MAG: DUF2917 domain-containing protein [Rubrivivax sp.]|nr:DUF2917 domain-containing protein [Rubrivivax sp.]